MQVDELGNIFKSFSEPVRLRILYLLLSAGELCVCDIVSSLQLSQSVVSRHLAYLRNGGLLTTRRKGVWIYYQLAEQSGFIIQLLEAFFSEGDRCELLKQDVKRLQRQSSDACC